MNYGAEFEKQVEEHSEARGYTCVKIPEEIRGFHGRGRGAQVRTRFDFAAGIKGTACFFEAKACGEGTFNFKSRVLSAKKRHQFMALKAAESNGNKSGYLIWFYNHKAYVWASSKCIQSLMDEGHNSLSPKSPYITTKPDDKPIDLMELMFSGEKT
jgi:hypothetical protein